MGNHSVGAQMTAFAKGFWNGRGDSAALLSQEEALKLLDIAAEDFVGADAEFDNELDSEDTPLGRLIAIAFGWSGEDWSDDKDEEIEEGDEEPEWFDGDEGTEWLDGPITKFRERYKFC